jgi:hypothetical protein
MHDARIIKDSVYHDEDAVNGCKKSVGMSKGQGRGDIIRGTGDQASPTGAGGGYGPLRAHNLQCRSSFPASVSPLARQWKPRAGRGMWQVLDRGCVPFSSARAW